MNRKNTMFYRILNIILELEKSHQDDLFFTISCNEVRNIILEITDLSVITKFLIEDMVLLCKLKRPATDYENRLNNAKTDLLYNILDRL